jgi:DNA invertase Pin-like site-specific DNA recombinase
MGMVRYWFRSKGIVYARVSTDGQSTENQLRELRAAIARHGWSIVAEYVDRGVSGAKGRKDRPRFDALLHAVTRKEFDMVAAWSVDRLGRSLQDLVGFLGDLQSKKVDLYLHQQALDTSTPSGKAMFGMLGVFADRSFSDEDCVGHWSVVNAVTPPY